MTDFQIYFLGPLELVYCGQRLPLPATRKAQALFAYLVLNREKPQTRDRLANLFWGNRPEENARRSLSTAVWQICHCLPQKEYIHSETQFLQFNPEIDLWLDVDQFESLINGKNLPELQSALTLYRGDFLEGSYEEWILSERYRLENLFLDGLASLMAGYEARGELNFALAASQRLLGHDALREEAYRTAMRVYNRLGKRNAALEQYQRCREIIRKELGTEPMIETSQLYQSILDGLPREIVIDPLKAGHIEPLHQKGYNPLDLNRAAPMLGRDDELAKLEAAWRQAKNTQGGLILISGEAGVGKTRLVEEFAKRLSWVGVQVLWGRCYEFERLLPYQPIAEALRSAQPILAQWKPGGEINRMVQEISRLVPELMVHYQEIQAQPAFPPHQEQAQFFEAVASFFDAISKPNGLLIVLEDLHWVAESTLEILHYLTRHLSAQPALILGTVRLEELGSRHPLRAFQEELKRAGLIQELSLGALSPVMVERLVSEMSGQDEAIQPLANRLYRETEGNPFFMMEVIKSLFERRSLYLEQGVWNGQFDQISEGKLPLPASLNDALQTRISRLEGEAQELLRIAAVIGREFDFNLLSDAWSQNEEKTLGIIDELLRCRLVEEGSGSTSRDYAFTHHKIQEVIYAGLSRRRRWQMHARIATLMEKNITQRTDEYFGELAFHFYQARQINQDFEEKAIIYSLKAGDQARVMYAHQEACGYYNQALELLKEKRDFERMARVNMKLGVAFHNAFRFELAHQAFETGFRFWQKSDDQYQTDIDPAPHPLRINWPSISSIDPAYAMDIPGAVACQLFSGLVAFSSDLEIVPDAAKTWELHAGGREYLFHLRDNMHWSDGRSLTAFDFEFSGKRILTPATRSPLANLLFDIRGAKSYHKGLAPEPTSVGLRAIDPSKLLIELEKPTSYFLQLLANLLPVPRHCIEANNNDWTKPGNIVTNGPFKLETWEKLASMQLVKYTDYHSRFSGNVTGVELDLHPDPSVHLERYTCGELDILDMRLFSMGAYELAIQKFAGEYFSFPSALIHFIGFNVRQSPFQDERIRKAFALAIDKEMLAEVKKRGSVFPGMGGFVPPGIPGHSPGIGLPFDPEEASILLVQAGYPQGRGFPKIHGLTPLSHDDPVNTYLTAQWQEILGVDVHWETVTSGFHFALEEQKPILFLYTWLGDYPDPDDFLGASQIQRWTGWRDENYLRLLEQTRMSIDQTERMRLFEQADRRLMEKAAIIPLSYGRQHLLLKPWVKRYPTSALFTWFWKDVVIGPHSPSD